MANTKAPIVAPEAATYAKLFPEQLADRCAPDAPESNSGPIAYLHALYQQVLALEATSTSDKRFTLADRRPDIGELLLDEAGLETKVAPLTLAINALTHCARSHAGASSNLLEVISQANYQTGLPCHYPLEQIQAVLKHKKIPLFELLQTSKNTFPNFCYGQLRTEELRQVMRTSTGFSPALQTLLLDSSATTAAGFLSDRFGVTAKGADALSQLRNVDFFCSKTGLKPQQVQDLLAISGVDDDAAHGISSVKSSSAYRAEGDAVAGGHLYGAAFINNGSTPALSLEDKRVGVGITLEIKGGTAAHFGRIHKVIHLQHALKLPFEDVDLLLMSAMRAEGQTKNFKITENTLRALGVFRFLSEIHGLTAPQFAALIHEVSPYAAAGHVSFLDRVLGASAVEKRASVGGELIIDGREFDPAEQPDSGGNSASALVIGQLSRALSLDERLTRSYLALATQALGLKKPALTLALVSSLYRLSQLPRLLRMSAEEGASLIGILRISNKDFLGIIAGKGFISDATDKPDILDVLVAVANTQRWLRRNRLSAQAVLSVLMPPVKGAQQPSADVLRITKVLAAYGLQVRTACYTQANMSSLDIGKFKLKSGKWQGLLKAYVDDSGLVKADLPEEKPLIKALDSALKGKLEKGDELIKEAATQMASLLTNALVAQEDLAENIVVEVLAQVMGASTVTSEHVLPLLDWVDTTPRDILANVLQATVADDVDSAADAEQSSKTFKLWAKLARHARAVHLMGLSADGLGALVYNTARFDLEEVADKGDTTVATLNLDLLYQLSCYRDWITTCQAKGFKENDALNWLLNQAIVEKPDEIKAAAKQLGELIGWENETVRFTGSTAQPAAKTPAQPSLLPPFARHISGIDLILRLKSLCDRTGLSCESLLYLSLLGEQSTYEQINIAGQMLLGACDEEARDVIEGHLQETWRDALAAYLMAYWVAADTAREAFMPTREDLSNYFLTDIWVTREARKTNAVTQAISSLQHYLHRLLAHLEPGYEAVELPQQVVDNWHRYLSQYGTWKTLCAQFNHPENLIYYASRPNKSAAFKDLEVEVNQISQGKLDTQRLQTAVLNYLTKFERLSNLQVISGYLDGRDPKSDTYYLIGKTNTSPTEYYLRSLDMGLRDDQQRLNPLAWSEWEKIALSPTGQIAQSAYNETIKVTQPKLKDGKEQKDAKGNIVTEEISQTITHVCDAVRPVIISGRPYVFWVERGTTDLPSKEGNGKTLAGKRKLSVHYVYRQSDGFWSTANELICLDGTKDGERLPDKDNPYLMDESYAPGLIAFVNVEDREEDPWLTVILYNSRSEALGTRDKDYFFEMRDLLLLERKSLDSALLTSLGKTSYNSYRNMNNIQHIYNGAQRWVKKIDQTEFSNDPAEMDLCNALTVSAEFLNPSTIKITAKINEFYLTLKARSTSSEGKSRQTYKQSYELEALEGHEFIEFYRRDEYVPIDHKALKVVTEIIPHKISAYGKFSESGVLEEITLQYNYKKTDESPLKFEIAIHIDNDILLHASYDVEIGQSKTDENWNISITHKNQAQYLDLSSVSDKEPKLASDKIRLNTLFGKQLVGRATESVERALDWDTQKLREPTIDDAYPNPTVDFHGANGLYFRELFLHLPALIANRLTEQQQFEDAENWYLGYLFDPYRAQPDEDGSPAYWNTRPLAEVGTLSSELLKPIDPVTRAFTLSRYYRQAVFLGLVENWQQQGDHYFRQLTLSSVNHAWLCYQQALKLIGPLPERAEVTRWSPTALASVTAGHFRNPVNQRVIELRDTLANRLYNLRHGLTINGKPLPDLRWSDEGEDPFASAKGGVNLIAGSYNSERTSIPAYRFRQLLPAARAAARQLADLGRHYMKLMEDESDATLSTLLTAQDIKMCEFTSQLQQEAIHSVQASKRTLELGRSAAQARKARFQALLDEGKSPMEEAATGLAITSKVSNAAAVPFEALEAIQKQIPTIFGMAFGGNHPDAFAAKIASTFRIIGDIAEFSSEQLVQEAIYERRASDWEFERQQADWDIKVIDQQIAETEIELRAAKLSLAEARQHRANLEEAYTVMTTGFVIVPIYNWLVSRQEQIYGAAYDAVLSLCLSLEAAWRYEIGDYTHQAFINTSAWRDAYKGMLAGESLLVDLQAMENAYIQANERRLTIKRSFSLKGMYKDWKQALDDLKAKKPLTFEFKARDFDLDYPGQYLRQLKHVSVSFVLGSGQSLEGLSAILTQTGNTTLVEPDETGASYLYTPTDAVPASIKRNLRAQQQIALSSSVSEDGLGYGPGEWVQELMFHDGRYLPFEGTGAISQWQLQMPGTSATSVLSDKVTVSDIRINLVYTAVPGDSALVTKTTELLGQSN